VADRRSLAPDTISHAELHACEGSIPNLRLDDLADAGSDGDRLSDRRPGMDPFATALRHDGVRLSEGAHARLDVIQPAD
jgi:hypothetical protein